MTKPDHRKHDHWEQWETDAQTDDRDTVMSRILDELEADEIHGLSITAQNGTTYYGVVSQSTTNSGGEVIDIRTIVIDLGKETVKVSSNGIWLPREGDVLDSVTSLVARTTTDVAVGSDAEPMTDSAIDVDLDSLLSTELAEDDYNPSGWGEDWGNGQGAPPEVYEFVDRLREAGVETERFSRLNYGEKSPWERYANRGASGLMGNYGVEMLEDDPLIVIDVDDPEEAPLEQLPETYAVSSPHGDDRRAHHFYKVPDSEAVKEHFGSWAVKPGWGDVWIGGEYVVGPGCVLDGCGKDHCTDCASPDGGRYEVLRDEPIEDIETDELIDLLESSWLEDDDDDVQEETVEVVDHDRDDEQDEEDDELVECADCGAVVDHDEADLVDRGGSPAYVCAGGECA